MMEQRLNPELLCSICLDKFKHPKLLPCRHTFCTRCLIGYLAKTHDTNEESTLKCPLCRSLTYVGPEGVAGLLTNFYVDVEKKTSNDDKKTRLCKSCSKEIIDRMECEHCGIVFCEQCSPKHNQEVRKARRRFFMSDTSPWELNPFLASGFESDSSTSSLSSLNSNQGNVNLPFGLQSSLCPIRTKFVVSLSSSFRLSSNIPGQIKKIIPVSENTCWLISTDCTNISLYNTDGRKLESVHIGEYIGGICQIKSGILFILPNSRRVGFFENREISTIVRTSTFKPIDVASFQDGRFVVVGADDTDHKDEGRIRIYSLDGQILEDFVKQYFNPYSVSVNNSCRTIYISNLRNNSVEIFTDNGAEVAKYKGGQRRQRRRSLFRSLSDSNEEHFMPLDLYSNLCDFVIVIDGSTCMLHVFDLDGNFMGPILADYSEIFEEPNCVAFDRFGQLWVGNFSGGTVKVFLVENYVNTFRDSSDDEF